MPPVTLMHPWEWPSRPWARVHIDHASPFLGKQFLVLIDAYSKWLEVTPVSSTSSTVTISCLQSIFATHGIPEVLVSDNGTSFTSAEFAEFTKRNGIRHITTAPYHPSSNGLAERAVQTFKAGMKKSTTPTSDVPTSVARFLFQYRITPHSVTGRSPAEMLMNRQPCSHLDLLHPNVEAKVIEEQVRQKLRYDGLSKERQFKVGDKVFVRKAPGLSTWLAGSIVAAKNSTSYQVVLEDGSELLRHVDHICHCYTKDTDNITSAAVHGDDWLPSSGDHQDMSTAAPLSGTSLDRSDHPQPPVRCSQRIRLPPDRFTPAAF